MNIVEMRKAVRAMCDEMLPDKAMSVYAEVRSVEHKHGKEAMEPELSFMVSAVGSGLCFPCEGATPEEALGVLRSNLIQVSGPKFLTLDKADKLAIETTECVTAES